MPKQGDIAYCGHGKLGLITCDQPTQVRYSNGDIGFAWTGIHLTTSGTTEIGCPWSSRNPSVIGNIEVALNLLMNGQYDDKYDEEYRRMSDTE